VTGRRIADGDVANRVGDSKEAGPSRVSRVGTALASPRGVLITVPLLVALVGIGVTLVGQHALENTSLAMARDRFVEQTASASQRMTQALEQADPVLDRIAELQATRSSSSPTLEFALVLRNLVAGRPGMTQAYAAFPDGTFQGVYVHDDGQLRFQESRVDSAGGTFHHYRFASGGLVRERDEATDYDPRKRAYYAVALRKGKRAWTSPYPFFTTRHTGVTRVEPLFAAGGALESVIAVDFDVSALSSFMAGAESSDVHALVFGEDGVVLAYPHAAAKIAGLKPTDHALNFRDIGDPTLNAFFAGLPKSGEVSTQDFWRFEVGKDGMLAAVAPIGGEAGPRWQVASIVAEQSFLRALNTHRRQSLLIAAGALLAAIGTAWFFARHIVQARRAVAIARAAADQATRQAMELGSYTLLECLGKGGMGEVWRAEHRLLARQAAIKLINAELTQVADMGQIQERFKREAQTIASLRSRNTVEIFDYGVTSDGTFFFVMELLDGIDLDSLTEKFGPQPASRVVTLLLQACNSLAEAHDAGLVHRDIKPANIFVCRAADEVDVVKVLDFGLVRAPNKSDEETRALSAVLPENWANAADPTRLTQQGSYLGTPTFIAPEQALGQEVDARADLYALGCVAWWLLTGRLVFPANDVNALLVAHMTQAPPPLRPLVRGPLPAELEQLILRCLSKNPTERPASARELAQALREIRFAPTEVWTTELGETWWRRLADAKREAKRPATGTGDTVASDDPTAVRARPA
jgi:serine/threonine protein kinase